MDWLDLLAVQGTLKSLLQYHSLKLSILWLSAFFIVLFSHPHMTTGKTIALTRQTFVGRVMSSLFNMLSGLVIAFLPRRKRLLISWLQSPSAVILELQKIKFLTVSNLDWKPEYYVVQILPTNVCCHLQYLKIGYRLQLLVNNFNRTNAKEDVNVEEYFNMKSETGPKSVLKLQSNIKFNSK